MQEPPWKRLVEELKDQGYESIDLDRLRAIKAKEAEALGIRRNDILERLYPIAPLPDRSA